MTIKEVRELLKSGRPIQFKCPDMEWKDGDENEDVTFVFSADQYRIKPESKLRPWRPEEVPVGALIADEERTWKAVITEVSCAQFHAGPDRAWYLVEPMPHNVFSTDGGKTWNVVGVLEESK